MQKRHKLLNRSVHTRGSVVSEVEEGRHLV